MTRIIHNIYTFDANKHYSSVLKFRKNPYIVATMWDTWEEFKEELHGDIPYGEYLLRQGDYKCTRTNLFFNHNLCSYTVIKELLHKKIIKKEDITHVRKVKQLLPSKYFEDFIDKVYSILPPKYAKQLVNSFIGGRNMLTNKKSYYYTMSMQTWLISCTQRRGMRCSKSVVSIRM